MSKRILILLAATFLLFVVSCDKNKDAEKEGESSEIITELIKENLLGSTNGIEIAKLDDSREVTEKIPGIEMSNLMAEQSKDTSIPAEEPITNGDKTEDKAEDKAEIYTAPPAAISSETIALDKPIETPKKEITKKPKTISTKKSTMKYTSSKTKGVKGCYIKIGSDKKYQIISPRKYAKLTMAVFNKYKYGRRVEFQLYAVPVGKKPRLITYYMIGLTRNIDIVNGQAQFTKYWNGKNISGRYLPKGKYSIYLLYKVKNSRGTVLGKKGRYWGNSRNYYIKLY